jgi:translation elongation factor EF-4
MRGKLKLNDAAITLSRIHPRFGIRFPLRFLGLLHMVIRERLEREFDLNLVTTRQGQYKVVRPTASSDDRATNHLRQQ